ncbi:LLM class F420-dependent oxidoreductase [Micromonospora sp. WMMA2032]|uniref:LLM class flavin-dependent oxidoreductase n=1 Tax=unclassified Micromonospora TaxID=2617518 RepID=UPI000C059553|nr:LLM class flavin-dependent oxidoreductase [Micromonospora sp. WMMA2032]ATO12644.1 LLM class F420-dependent oxidoreductase [Micromonospora sp. WMMA2032]
MKLAVNLVYQDAALLARTAEELGYAVALAPEGYRSEAASLLGAVAASTDRIGLASGVMQIPARTPGLAALTAATLDALSGGRFRLGLGVSNAEVSDGWYGVPFDEPLRRTREYVDIVRAALRGGPVRYAGRHFRLPRDGAGSAPLHLLTTPLRADLPIWLAAVGPKNLRLAGEIADGWIGVFTSPALAAEAIGQVRAGRERVGRTMVGFETLPCLPTAIADDVTEAVDLVRGQYAYLLGIGDPERNVYVALARRLGYVGEVEKVHDLVLAGDRVAAGAAVPEGFVLQTALVGPPDRVAGRMREYAEAGVTTLGVMVSAAATDTAGRVAILRRAAQALRRAGLAED